MKAERATERKGRREPQGLAEAREDSYLAGAKLPDGTLKKISEPKLLTGEHKFKPAFNFINRAFPILLCNNPPSLADLSSGMIRRLLVLPFGRAFREDEVDVDLFDRIILRELPGVLNRVLVGWQNLKRRSHFPRSRDVARRPTGASRARQPA